MQDALAVEMDWFQSQVGEDPASGVGDGGYEDDVGEKKVVDGGVGTDGVPYALDVGEREGGGGGGGEGEEDGC